MKAPNIFLTLSKYGSYEEENYLTESFVFLLKLLLERNPNTALPFINQICGLLDEAHFTNSKSITISTQIVVDEGRPDIEIRDCTDKLVYIEVKHDAPLGKGQLEYYKRKLIESGISHTGLVLLTRSRISAQETTLDEEEYHHICWYEIHYWLSRLTLEDEVSKYFIKQFMFFLESKQMSMKQVTWEYINGVPALVALTDMMEVALAETRPETKIGRTAGWGWRGFSINEGDGYWCGVRYNKPLTVVFENGSNNNQTFKYDLDLNEIHFFSLNHAEQFECLVDFLKQAFSVMMES